jgi:hypothetical protein
MAAGTWLFAWAAARYEPTWLTQMPRASGWIGAGILIAGMVHGASSFASMPPKRQRFAVALLGLTGLVAALYLGRAGFAEGRDARVLPMLGAYYALGLGMLVIADLAIFHRHYFLDRPGQAAGTPLGKGEAARQAVLAALDGLVAPELAPGAPAPSGRFADFAFRVRVVGAAGAAGDWFRLAPHGPGETRLYFGRVAHGDGTAASAPLALAAARAAAIACLAEAQRLGLGLEATARQTNERFLALFARRLTTTLTGLSLGDDGTVEVLNCGGVGLVAVSRDGPHHQPLSSTPIGASSDFTPCTVPLSVEDDAVLLFASPGLAADAAALSRALARVEASDSAAASEAQRLEAELADGGVGVLVVVEKSGASCAVRIAAAK